MRLISRPPPSRAVLRARRSAARRISFQSVSPMMVTARRLLFSKAGINDGLAGWFSLRIGAGTDEHFDVIAILLALVLGFLATGKLGADAGGFHQMPAKARGSGLEVVKHRLGTGAQGPAAGILGRRLGQLGKRGLGFPQAVYAKG